VNSDQCGGGHSMWKETCLRHGKDSVRALVEIPERTPEHDTRRLRRRPYVACSKRWIHTDFQSSENGPCIGMVATVHGLCVKETKGNVAIITKHTSKEENILPHHLPQKIDRLGGTTPDHGSCCKYHQRRVGRAKRGIGCACCIL